MIRTGVRGLSLEEYAELERYEWTRTARPTVGNRNVGPDLVSEVMAALAESKTQKEVEAAQKQKLVFRIKFMLGQVSENSGLILWIIKVLVLFWIGLMLILFLANLIRTFPPHGSILIRSERTEYQSYFGQELKWIKCHEVKYNEYFDMIRKNWNAGSPVSKVGRVEIGGLIGFIFGKIKNWISN